MDGWKMHKILEIKKEGASIYITIEAIETQFLFDLKDIKDKVDLKAKIKYAIECELKNQEEDIDTKYNELKTLEGTNA